MVKHWRRMNLRWRKQKCDRGRESEQARTRRNWSSLTLTESIFWQASASCNNLEIISIHKGPAVWQSKCSVPDRSLRFSQLPVSVCAGPASISGLLPLSPSLPPSLPPSLCRTERDDEVRKRMKRWGGMEMRVMMSNWEKQKEIENIKSRFLRNNSAK